jgi:hypothetical protein
MVQIHHVGKTFDAGGAPTGPEVDDSDFAALLLQNFLPTGKPYRLHCGLGVCLPILICPGGTEESKT